MKRSAQRGACPRLTDLAEAHARVLKKPVLAHGTVAFYTGRGIGVRYHASFIYELREGAWGFCLCARSTISVRCRLQDLCKVHLHACNGITKLTYCRQFGKELRGTSCIVNPNDWVWWNVQTGLWTREDGAPFDCDLRLVPRESKRPRDEGTLRQGCVYRSPGGQCYLALRRMGRWLLVPYCGDDPQDTKRAFVDMDGALEVSLLFQLAMHGNWTVERRFPRFVSIKKKESE